MKLPTPRQWLTLIRSGKIEFRTLATLLAVVALLLVFGLVAGFRGVMRAVTRAERAAEATDRG